MRKKYLYIIIGWVLVFTIYSLLLFLFSTEKSEKKNIDIKNETIFEKKDKIISIDITGFNNKIEKIPIILEENMQQHGIYRRVINLLLKRKNMNVFFNKIKLNEVYFIKGENGIVVDFNEEMITLFPGGTSAEFEFINYISDNLFLINTYLNADYEGFEEINWISFLSSGSNFPSISGHIDMEQPFLKNSKIITPYVNVRKLMNINEVSHKPIQRIFIDPGHGGENKGVISESDELEEKNLTLIIGQTLRRQIINTFGIDTILTRSFDKNMSLDSRTSMANNQKSGLFISIHVNYSFKSYKKGGETYIASFNPILKNSVINRIENLNKTKDIIDEINKNTASIEENISKEKEELEIWNRAQEKYLPESYKVAQLIQAELNSLNSTFGRKVRQIPIKILSSVSMPAVLIEVAFLSNRGDREKLKRKDYLNKISNAIFKGISYYINSQINVSY